MIFKKENIFIGIYNEIFNGLIFSKWNYMRDWDFYDVEYDEREIYWRENELELKK